MRIDKTFDFEGSVEDGSWHELTGGYRKVLPLGWEPYGDPDRMPEYGFPHPDDVHLDKLVKTGSKSIQYGLNWSTHDGGCYYVLDTKVGDKIRFWMHGRYIYDHPSDNVEPGDTVGDIHMRIGIGSSPDATDVVWSPEQEISVEGYAGEPGWYRFEVEAVAQGDATVLFLHTAPRWAGFRHNGPVWDDGGVEIIREQPEPPPSPFDYPSFVWYVPQTVSGADYITICQQAHDASFRSVTRSEHDAIAMVSLSPEPHIVAWESGHRREELENFWRIFCPELDLTFRTLDEPPEPPPEPRKLGAGLHLQTGVEGDIEYYERAKPSYVKLFSFEQAAAFKAANPDVVVGVRYYTSDQHIPQILSRVHTQQMLDGLSIASLMWHLEQQRQTKDVRFRAYATDMVRGEVKRRLAAGPADAAASYIATFVDALRANHRSVDYVEGFNEMIGSSDREFNKLVVEFETAFAYQIADLGLDTRACLLNVAVGNPPEDQVVDLLPAARAAVETDGCVGYHAYWWGNQEESGLVSWWQWHAGRWQEWDKVFNTYGLAPTYLLTECGPVGSDDGYHLKPHEGWRSNACLAGNLDRLVSEKNVFESLIDAWNIKHGNRCPGYCLFTSGIGVGWDLFQIGKTEMAYL